MRLLSCLLIALLTFTPTLGGAQVNLPNLGESSADELPPRLERRIGEEAMREIRRDKDHIDDVEVTQYLNRLASDLVSHAAEPTEISVFGVRDGRINAFAMPGGFIGINSGLMLAAQSESEVASVMAHEIGHVTQRHIARRIARQKQDVWMTLATVAAAIVAANVGGGQGTEAALMMGTAAQADAQLKFGRDAEREADRVGYDMLHRARFDTQGMVSFFGRLQRASRLAESASDAYVRSHPVTTERMSDIQNRLRSTSTRQHVDSDDFYLVRAKMRVLQAASRQEVIEAEKSLRTTADNGSARQQAAQWYGAAFASLTRGDLAGAQNGLRKARERLGREHPMLDSLSARIRLVSKDGEGALQELEAALKRSPEWRSLVYAKVDALQLVGRHDEAIALLKREIAIRGSEAEFYKLIAQSYAAANKPLEQHRMLAEYYVRLGAIPAAVEQLTIARSQPGNFYDYSQIDARMRELKAQVEEELRMKR